MLTSWPVHDPEDILDYALDYSNIFDAGESIITSLWKITSGSVTITNQSFSATKTVVWLSGGLPAENCVVKNIITTSSGRTISRSCILPIGPHS